MRQGWTIFGQEHKNSPRQNGSNRSLPNINKVKIKAELREMVEWPNFSAEQLWKYDIPKEMWDKDKIRLLRRQYARRKWVNRGYCISGRYLFENVKYVAQNDIQINLCHRSPLLGSRVYAFKEQYLQFSNSLLINWSVLSSHSRLKATSISFQMVY